jgi:hypothetical protein
MALVDELEKKRRDDEERWQLAQAAIPEWKAAVQRLFERIQRDLEEVLSRGLVKMQIYMAHKADPAWGEYDIQRLILTDSSAHGGKTITFEPLGSDVVGADGRIDLLDVGVRKCNLMWKAPSSWVFVFPHRQRGRASTERMPYSKEALERVLGDLLLGGNARR